MSFNTDLVLTIMVLICFGKNIMIFVLTFIDFSPKLLRVLFIVLYLRLTMLCLSFDIAEDSDSLCKIVMINYVMRNSL